MADDRRNKKRGSGGRVTPKGGQTPSPGASSRPGREPKPIGQVGRRPSSPKFLLAVAIAWIACGIAAFFLFSASWRIVVGVVFIGIGLYWLRGALATVTRHEERLGDDGQ